MATSFRDGFKFVDGTKYEPLVAKRTASKSRPDREPYRTVFWADGMTSCNCTGWATHKHCTHCTKLEQEVESGYLGPAVRDIRRLALLRSAGTMQPRVEMERTPSVRRQSRPRVSVAEYEIEPKVAPPIPAKALDGNPVVYRRIRLD